MGELLEQTFADFLAKREPIELDSRVLGAFEDILVKSVLPMSEALPPHLQQRGEQEWRFRDPLSVSHIKPRGFLGNLLGITVSWIEKPAHSIPSVRGRLSDDLSHEDVTAIRLSADMYSGRTSLGLTGRGIWYLRSPHYKGNSATTYWRRVIGPDEHNDAVTEHLSASMRRTGQGEARFNRGGLGSRYQKRRTI